MKINRIMCILFVIIGIFIFKRYIFSYSYMNNQIGDNNSNIEVSEKIENLHSKKVHTEYITIEAKPYSEARGTLEHIHDDHLEISEEKTSVNNNKMLIYKEKGDYKQELYPDVVYWVPQIAGMQDQEKQERINALLKDTSRDWLYVDWLRMQTGLYLEYISDKYISYSYGLHAEWGPSYGWSDINVAVTIDIENEKRVLLDDFVYLDDESFILNFAKYCFGSEEYIDDARESLQAANRTIADLRKEKMENGSISSNDLIQVIDIEVFPTFFLRPNKLMLNYTKWNCDEVTMELPVFIEYLKVEPWE